MNSKVLQYAATDDTPTNARRVPKAAEAFLRLINDKVVECTATANRDPRIAIVANEIATGLRSRVEDVCAQGIWKELQHLEKDIDKFEYTLRQAIRGIGKKDRRSSARGQTK